MVLAGRVLVVMGVSGSGKTTIGQRLAASLGWAFQDADDLHPAANIHKMVAGHPLDDADRAPWLAALHDWVRRRLAAGDHAILAASLLKRVYRDQVIGGDPAVRLLYLYGAPDLLRARMEARDGHFMAPSMLNGQLTTLEPPVDAERPLRVCVTGTPEETTSAALLALAA
jgi:gluconokinase